MADHFDRLGVEHPAQYRDRLSRWRIWTPLIAPFLIWGTRLITKFFLMDAVCGRALGAHAVGDPSTVRIWVGVMDVLVIAALLGIAALGWDNWRRVKGEHARHHRLLLDIGEGRTETMAHWGLLMAAGFATVALFDSVPTLLSPICEY